MIYIYNCYGGTHSSSLAAAVHLGRLPADRMPAEDEILNTDYFNKLTYKDMGKLIYRGMDTEGNRVYTIGRGRSRHLVPGLKDMVSALARDYNFEEKVVFSNMSPSVNLYMTFGGFFSRALGIDFIGVPFLAKGSIKAYKNIRTIVDNTIVKAKSFEGPVLVLENKEFEVNRLRH